jgi:DNA sulfur modification protein DndC
MKEIAEIKDRLRDVNIVSFSGGKDSTIVLHLVLNALREFMAAEGGAPPLYIVTSDTLMEIPFYQEYVDRIRRQIKDYVDAACIDAEIITVRPDLSLTFWVCVLGKGYPAAHMGFRWCTGVLKVDPIERFTKTITEGKDYTVFIGVRRAESELRAKIYKKKDYKPNHYAPILDWQNQDVWTYLLTEPCLWGSHEELVKVYRYSSDECVYGEKQGVCIGNARYGCWACPLQRSTQLNMIGYHTGDPRYRLLREYKETLVNMANNTAYRSRIRRNGEEGAGPFLVKIRKQLYSALKRLEDKTQWPLISRGEEEIIFDYWTTEDDIHNIPDDTSPMLWEVCG